MANQNDQRGRRIGGCFLRCVVEVSCIKYIYCCIRQVFGYGVQGSGWLIYFYGVRRLTRILSI